MPSRQYFLTERDDKTLLAYENYATQLAIMFGADPTVAENDMKNMVDFEIQLANASFLKKNIVSKYTFNNSLQTKQKHRYSARNNRNAPYTLYFVPVSQPHTNKSFI